MSPPPESDRPGGGLRRSGTVHASVGGVYDVVLDDGERVEATLRGRVKRRDAGTRVVIGDRVEVGRSGEAWTIESVADRDTLLVRRGAGGRRAKPLAANLDRVFVVVAASDPPAHTVLVDRLLAVAEASGMRPALVVNKVDLPGAAAVAEDLAGLYRRLGYTVFTTSARGGPGLDALAAEICRGRSALVGPSGVGKSTLLNAVDPELDLRTGELSRKTGRGRHTTVNARLIELSCGGTVADTPGFGDVGLWGLAEEEVQDCFPEFAPHLDDCRFRGCAHASEPDCAVRAAVAEGRIPRTRYDSYRTLRQEAAEAAAR